MEITFGPSLKVPVILLPLRTLKIQQKTPQPTLEKNSVNFGKTTQPFLLIQAVSTLPKDMCTYLFSTPSALAILQSQCQMSDVPSADCAVMPLQTWCNWLADLDPDSELNRTQGT